MHPESGLSIRLQESEIKQANPRTTSRLGLVLSIHERVRLGLDEIHKVAGKIQHSVDTTL